ncbi:hypothetical protein ACFO4O_10585 [Glaciecola siphonariae]|uniref:Uncharacterized protein n=1 Tax=Glaciecola siphonariae TaxID=521012 RepID=A0ABV9LVR2_9ALTE
MDERQTRLKLIRQYKANCMSVMLALSLLPVNTFGLMAVLDSDNTAIKILLSSSLLFIAFLAFYMFYKQKSIRCPGCQNPFFSVKRCFLASAKPDWEVTCNHCTVSLRELPEVQQLEANSD